MRWAGYLMLQSSNCHTVDTCFEHRSASPSFTESTDSS